MNNPEIESRLKTIAKFYDLNALLQHDTANQDVAKYYRKSDFFYNLVHSGGGKNIHMALSDDGVFIEKISENRPNTSLASLNQVVEF